jgi:hypothetical protein
MKEPPQMIEADGQTFVACGTDTVYVTNEGAWFGGDTTFRVKFTDANGLSHAVTWSRVHCSFSITACRTRRRRARSTSERRLEGRCATAFAAMADPSVRGLKRIPGRRCVVSDTAKGCSLKIRVTENGVRFRKTNL